jgi:hypothetical protein
MFYFSLLICETFKPKITTKVQWVESYIQIEKSIFFEIVNIFSFQMMFLKI